MATKKKYVIVRCQNSGVHCGLFFARKGREVTLTNARRLWYWKAASGFTLSGVANNGLGEGSKPSEAVKTILLLDALEIIPCSVAAAKSLAAFPSHTP
jgi:hypothetical protein